MPDIFFFITQASRSEVVMTKTLIPQHLNIFQAQGQTDSQRWSGVDKRGAWERGLVELD